jgi:hypothetical protein
MRPKATFMIKLSVICFVVDLLGPALFYAEYIATHNLLAKTRSTMLLVGTAFWIIVALIWGKIADKEKEDGNGND